MFFKHVLIIADCGVMNINMCAYPSNGQLGFKMKLIRFILVAIVVATLWVEDADCGRGSLARKFIQKHMTKV